MPIKRVVKDTARSFGYYVGTLPVDTLAEHLRTLFAALEINCVFDVGAHFGEYGALLRVAGEVRSALQREGRRVPADLWQRALSPEVLDLVRQSRSQEAAALLTESLRPGLVQR